MVSSRLLWRPTGLVATGLENGRLNTQGKLGETTSVGTIVGIAKAVGMHKQTQADSTQAMSYAPLMRTLRVTNTKNDTKHKQFNEETNPFKKLDIVYCLAGSDEEESGLFQRELKVVQTRI